MNMAEKIRVMIAGLPGNMATLVANAIVSQKDMKLCRHALGESAQEVRISTTERVYLIPVDRHADFLRANREEIDLIVDFTLPRSANQNAQLYCSAGIPFVMGTTGGDRDKLAEIVRASSISAVIANNMSVPVVIIQDALRSAAEKYKGALNGYKMVIRESHQAKKEDPSGTAIGFLPYFEALGIPFTKDQIKMVRDPVVQQVEMGIPAENLGGHGYHSYFFQSPDGSVDVQLQHNIRGRNTYVDGALMAIRFRAKHNFAVGVVDSMIEVMQDA